MVAWVTELTNAADAEWRKLRQEWTFRRNRARSTERHNRTEQWKTPSQQGVFGIGAPRFELGTSSPPD
jgi:hypothetical protein